MLASLSFGQINLVFNPSLEIVTFCPGEWNGGEIQIVAGWDTLRNGDGSTPDIFNVCYTHVNKRYDVPENQNGFQHPHFGDGYGGFVAIYPDFQVREYIQGTLSQTLTSGNTYCVKMYLSLSNSSKKSIKTIAAYLDNGQITADAWNFQLPDVIPQVVNVTQQLNDTLIWMEIEGSFIADGTEEYITVGNFSPDSLSDIVLSYPSGTLNGAYYYIDDVSVIDQSTPAYAGNDTLISVGDSVFVGRTPEIGLNEACVWYTNGIATDTIAGMWVKPSQTTTYIVEQNLCGQIDRDTVTVSIGIAGLDEVQTQNGIRLYPNPSTGEIWISTDEQGEASIEILTLNGSPVYEVEVSEISGNTKLSVSLTNGMYLLVVKTNAKKYTNRIVVVH